MFESPKDYEEYLDILKEYKEQFHFKLFAYCLMSNHVHLVIKTDEVSLETIFRHINTKYSMWFNYKYQRAGFLLQGRFYSEPIESEQYLINAVRYVHRNPAKAGLEPFPGHSYKWSSIYEYITGKLYITDTDSIAAYFNDIDTFFTFQQAHCEAAEEEFIDLENIKKRITDDAARIIIKETSGCSTAAEFQALSLSQRNYYIRELHDKGISIRQLNRLTGVSRGLISRIVIKK